ncbi:EAL domain-containing protein [Cognatiluteimonas weifangensis]|uniref:EAL domain-containing protein n=1 Tax=Cognatiluteimonas weifangensis TaxID=2303539 RepID=A0A372DMK5_9GAMM|nr:EAL domain-containing protein [Luteimonas weifangensis]RFP60739.1 EAL domain-containing protein [Luteimonas weifangensis]
MPAPVVAPALARLAEALTDALPAGSDVVVAWRDPDAGNGVSATPGAGPPLHALARACLDGDVPPQSASVLGEAWNEGDARIALAAQLGDALPPAARAVWLALVRCTVAATLAAVRAQGRIESLQKSQRLQQALYEIADLAGSGLEMQEMLGRLHAVVAGLMYAENFYIVLYDDIRESVRFLYFADRLDPYVAEPDTEISIAEMPNSLTVALLRQGRPLLGPSARLRQELGVHLDLRHGPDSADWLGVPMRRDDRVSGAIVVQSYDHPASYSHEDRALLEYVAQHILTALDRKHAQVELERRVDERTLELQQANLVLQAEIVERQRAERLQRALYRITELSVTAGSMEHFYADLHAVVGELLYARNFYIALLTQDGKHIEFPYSVDERDSTRVTRRIANGLTEYVITQGEALLADRARIAELEATGDVRSHGALAHCWLGVPLLRDSAVVGAIAVQSYTPDIAFSPRDQELLTFVAHHIGGGLARKRAQEYLKAAHAELEFRVESRTQELAGANRELRAQIGERVRAEQRLTHQARHDALTGLPNRPQLLERLDAAINRMRGSADGGFAVLFLDLDRFKLINDSIGHAAGDEMLVEIGRRIAGALGEEGVVARFGGDEFAILAEQVADGAGSVALATRILEALGKPLWLGGRELFPSASIGIAQWQPRYRLGEELLRDADAAMYRAKAEGRDRSALFDEAMRAHAIRLLDLEADLRRAIMGDAFEPHFQPIVRLADGVVVGHEALLRWNHDLHGALPPGEFIGVGEDSGLIEQVDWLIYERVIAWLRDQREGYVSINVSPRHFHSDDFAERLLRMLDAAGADPHRLRIEITEGALLDDAPRALRMLNTLRGRGVQALLDDFGTGFSALSYLHRFPIQSLKIDRSFVSGLDGETRAESLALVRAILALAGTLGIDTIGEGIETPAQRDILLELGCQFGQGYFYGHPQPA